MPSSTTKFSANSVLKNAYINMTMLTQKIMCIIDNGLLNPFDVLFVIYK